MTELERLKQNHDMAMSRVLAENERRNLLNEMARQAVIERGDDEYDCAEEWLKIPYFLDLREGIWPDEDRRAVKAYSDEMRKVSQAEQRNQEQRDRRRREKAVRKAEAEKQAKAERRALRKRQAANRLEKRVRQQKNRDLVYNAIASGCETHGQLIKKLDIDHGELKSAIRWLMRKGLESKFGGICKLSARRYGTK